MKAVVLAFIVGVAGLMAFLLLRGECPGGQVFATEAACRAANLSDTLCRASFIEARRKAVEDSSPFSNQDACLRSFPRCEPHTRVVGGYVPTPRGVCVAPGRAGDPVFERIGQSLNPPGK